MGRRKKGQPTGKQRRKEKARLKFVRTVQDVWTPFEPADCEGTDPELDGQLYWNTRYHVFVRHFESKEFGGTMTHLSIKRNDKAPLHDWRDLQRIKNELCGEDREAIELYPSEERVVDMANQYHLWVLPKGCAVPLGFFEGTQKGTPKEAQDVGAKQRPFEE